MRKLIRMIESAIKDEKEAMAFYDKMLQRVDSLQSLAGNNHPALNSIGRNIVNIQNQEQKHLEYLQDLFYSILKGVTPPRDV